MSSLLTLPNEPHTLAIPRGDNLPDAERVMAVARILYSGGMTNKHITRPEHIAARIIAGRELGLSAVQSVNWIAIINGRAVIWGDAALALVRASGRMEGDVTERWEGEGDDRVAVCVTKRKGAAEARETRFSVADAKKADLWGKEGPWQQYPDRQLMWRARGWNLRDNFNDVLCGLGIAEEELDVPVRQLPAKVDLPASPPALAGKRVEVVGEEVADDATIRRIAEARPAYLRGKGVDTTDEAAVVAAWREVLAGYGVTSAKQLSPAKAAELLATMRGEGHQQEIKEVFGEAASARS